VCVCVRSVMYVTSIAMFAHRSVLSILSQKLNSCHTHITHHRTRKTLRSRISSHHTRQDQGICWNTRIYCSRNDKESELWSGCRYLQLWSHGVQNAQWHCMSFVHVVICVMCGVYVPCVMCGMGIFRNTQKDTQHTGRNEHTYVHTPHTHKHTQKHTQP